MYKKFKILALIPARGGSKGISGKNSKLLCGKPLIAWTIEAAKASRYIDSLVLSTDNQELADLGSDFGAEVPFLRPKKLATDRASSIDVVLHALKEKPGFDYVLFLQPTSPLRTAQDIDDCLELAFKSRVKSCVSVCESPVHPFLIYKIGKDRALSPFLKSSQSLRRQDLSKAFVLNGAMYLSEVSRLRRKNEFIDARTLAYVMPSERSVDIDDMDDWAEAETYLSASGK